jgi:hypothetical protein
LIPWFRCPNRQSSLTIDQNNRKTDFSHPAIERKRKTFSENKSLNVWISKYSKTSTSNDQHETIIGQLEGMGCCSILALSQAIT